MNFLEWYNFLSSTFQNSFPRTILTAKRGDPFSDKIESNVLSLLGSEISAGRPKSGNKGTTPLRRPPSAPRSAPLALRTAPTPLRIPSAHDLPRPAARPEHRSALAFSGLALPQPGAEDGLRAIQGTASSRGSAWPFHFRRGPPGSLHAHR